MLFVFLTINEDDKTYLLLIASPLTSISICFGWKYVASLCATKYSITFLPNSFLAISFASCISSGINA